MGLRVSALIRVRLMDGTVCRMAPRAVCLFLERGKIVQFERASGWTDISRLHSVETAEEKLN